MSVVMELQPMDNNNIADEADHIQHITPVVPGYSGNGRHNAAAISENTPCLSEIEREPCEIEIEIDGTKTTKPDSAIDRVKHRLNAEVWRGGLKLWKVLLILLAVIICVIFLSIYLSTVIYEDRDEKYDVSQFVVPRVFSGRVSMVNQNFSKDNTTLHEQAMYLQNKLNAVYNSSHALSRYFRYTRVKTLRPGSIIIDFCLQFRMPLDSDQLVRYTLSPGMVSSVLRQHLYEQDADGHDPLLILPTSVSIQDGGATCTS